MSIFLPTVQLLARLEAAEGTEEAHRSEETDGEDQDLHLPGISSMLRLHGRDFVTLL